MQACQRKQVKDTMMLCRCTRTWIFFDDVSGHKLDHAMAKKTRTSEIWVSPAKVPRAEAIANGCKVMSTRWMDVNKGDDKAPNYRSRFVGREIEKRTSDSTCLLRHHLEAHNPHLFMSIEVSRAYFTPRLNGRSMTKSRLRIGSLVTRIK